MTTFRIKVDDGPEQTIEVATGAYMYAAAAVPALLDLALPVEVEIWVPDFKHFRYRIRENEFGHLTLDLLVRRTPTFT